MGGVSAGNALRAEAAEPVAFQVGVGFEPPGAAQGGGEFGRLNLGSKLFGDIVDGEGRAGENQGFAFGWGQRFDHAGH
jgi:hypothetical protein